MRLTMLVRYLASTSNDGRKLLSKQNEYYSVESEL